MSTSFMRLANQGYEMTATLDTNLLLRLTLRDIPGQYEAVRDLLAVPGARYRVTDTVINELVYALIHHYAFSRPQVAEIVRTILTDATIEANAALLGRVIEQFEHHPAMSYTDCYLAEEALASGNVPLLTFDKKLAAQHVAARLVLSGGVTPG